MANPTQQGHVKRHDRQGISEIEFYNPLSNSLPGKLLKELAEIITAAGNDPEVRVILLRSAGERAFCAGASFDELVAIDNEATGKVFFSGFARVINAIRHCPKLVVGRVQGKAVGGAVGLAAAVDYCLATEHAAIKLSELAVGIGPFVVGPAVERKVGLSAFSELTLNPADWRSAQWARDRGLYMEIFSDIEALDQGLEKFLDQLRGYNPEALSELKKVFWQGTEHWEELLSERAAISGRLVLSDFTREAINRFKQK
jgi:Enoyl-CoA hydratase/carnithine racemase